MILVVDDDPRILTGTSRVLSEAGYQTFSALNGTAALRILAAEAGIDLLVTDVLMPGISGPELAEQAKIIRAGLRVVFVSGDVGDTLKSAFGNHELLTKPFTAAALIAAVARAKIST